jgi:hypothetical protein
MVAGGMIDDEVDDHSHSERLRVAHAFHEVPGRAVLGVDAIVVRDVVAIIAVRRRVERLEPETGDAQAVQVFQPPAQPLEIADAVPARVHVLVDVEAVQDRILVPEVLDGHAIPISKRRSGETMDNRQPVTGGRAGPAAGGVPSPARAAAWLHASWCWRPAGRVARYLGRVSTRRARCCFLTSRCQRQNDASRKSVIEPRRARRNDRSGPARVAAIPTTTTVFIVVTLTRCAREGEVNSAPASARTRSGAGSGHGVKSQGREIAQAIGRRWHVDGPPR